MKFQGIPYPIFNNAQGLMHIQGGVRQIKSDLLVLLLTNPGERVFLPAFGTPLRQLLFEPNDPTVSAQAKQMIINSINTWEPRVVIQNITVTNSGIPSLLNSQDNKTEVDAILSISITFVDPDQISEVQTLTLEVPLAGG